MRVQVVANKQPSDERQRKLQVKFLALRIPVPSPSHHNRDQDAACQDQRGRIQESAVLTKRERQHSPDISHL